MAWRVVSWAVRGTIGFRGFCFMVPTQGLCRWGTRIVSPFQAKEAGEELKSIKQERPKISLLETSNQKIKRGNNLVALFLE